MPPGTWVLLSVVRTGDKSTGGLVVHSATLYGDIIIGKISGLVSPSIEEGLSLCDNLLREGINTQSFCLHCFSHSVFGILAAG